MRVEAAASRHERGAPIEGVDGDHRADGARRPERAAESDTERPDRVEERGLCIEAAALGAQRTEIRQHIRLLYLRPLDAYKRRKELVERFVRDLTHLV